MKRYALFLPLCFILVLAMPAPFRTATPDPGGYGPYSVDRITITTTNSDTGSELETDLYYPSSGGDVDPSGAPYPSLVFAHGTTSPRTSHAGNAEHLASWGFIVALPTLPDNDMEIRGNDTRYLLDYLEAENARASSLLYQRIDTDRLSVAGHSLGGGSSLLVASRDERIEKGIVLHDPVNPDDNFWDYEAEGPNITAPTGLIGSPSHMCNYNAKYEEEYPHLGATHKAKFVIADANHCDFLDAENPLMSQICGFICGGGFSEDRLAIAEHYTAAWLNYYVHFDTDYFTYLYGDEADADIQDGKITREVHTAPRDVVATAKANGLELGWTLYDHPIIAGYNIYRSQQSGSYPGTPHAQVGRVSSYVDSAVVAGQRYYYTLRSRDAAGNEHGPSAEVSAVAQGGTAPGIPVLLSPPDSTVTADQNVTFEWQAGAGAPPEGYELKVDGTVYTTSDTTKSLTLSLGTHTWTVRAYQASDYSDWAATRSLEVAETLPPPGVPIQLTPPDGAVTMNQSVTLAWKSGTGGTPAGYSLQLDSMVFTTTQTSWLAALSEGEHAWSVQAYNDSGTSGWTVDWTFTIRRFPVYLPLVLKLNDGS